MQAYFIGFLSGVISIIAVGIFVWTIRRGKTDTSGTLKGRTDRNNISTERGLGSLKTNNRESGRIINEAQSEAGRGLETIKDTNRTVSDIIADAKRDGKTEPKG